MGGWTVFQGKKYTNYGVATAAVKLVNAILSDSLTELAINCTNANREDITPMSKAVKWYSFLMNGSTGKIRLIPRQIKNLT